MPRMKDLTGLKFDKLTVIKLSEIRLSNKPTWECQCECGKIVNVRGECLTSGHTKSCGCGQGVKIQPNDRFGNLTVIKKIGHASNKKRTVLWECQCDCGNIINYTTAQLRQTGKTNCGCIPKEKKSRVKNRATDLTGQRFGKLIVESRFIEENQSDKKLRVKWNCKCDCGNTCVKRADYLKVAKNISCGCENISYGEQAIIELLLDNNISFETQKTFDNCRFPNTSNKARFDFYVNNKYLIEYDGVQHFEFSNSGWDTEKQFYITKVRDDFKNKWCVENNIPLIRIPYTHLSLLKIEDLLLETSNFIINKNMGV